VRDALFFCFAGVQVLFFLFSPGNQKPRGSVLVSLDGAVGALSPVGSPKRLDRRGVALTQGARTLVIKLSVLFLQFHFKLFMFMLIHLSS
jgi:hypothetical protein